MKLWEKGISTDQLIEKFTIGNDRTLDVFLAPYDLQASKAHAKMLGKVNLLSPSEVNQIVVELEQMEQQVVGKTFTIEPDFEDVHSKIEFELTKALGETGKKINTARSRNDQVLVAMHLYFKENIKTIQSKTNNFIESLLALAERYRENPMPGYTHLQVAMPSSFGLWFSAYAELLIDDLHMLESALKIVDQNPLRSEE